VSDKYQQAVIMSAQRLRTENRLLRQRVELLEAESSELADRLVRGQVSRAEEEETTFVVQRELAALRHTHLETSHQLEIAHEEIRNLSLLMEETVSFDPCVLLWAGFHHATLIL
jgi:predicted nuclease with TOPRIM domain